MKRQKAYDNFKKAKITGLMLPILILLFTAFGSGCNRADLSSGPPFTESSAADDIYEYSKAKGDSTRLKVYALEGGYGKEIWEELKAAFEEENKGVTVELTVDKQIEQLISQAMEDGNYPDVAHVAVGRKAGLTEKLTRERELFPLNDIMDTITAHEDVSIRKKLLPGFLSSVGTNPYGDGTTYYAPMFYSPTGLFYNVALMDAKGWSLPDTWDEMWALGDAALEEGIYLFTYPTPGYFDSLIYSMLFSSGGSDFYNSVMMYEEGVWNTDSARRVLEIIAKLAKYTHPKTFKNSDNENYLKNQQLILDNKAIFCPAGVWLPREMQGFDRAEGFVWGYTPVPAVREGFDKSFYTYFEQAWIPRAAENKDLAKQWVAFMYSVKAADILAKHDMVQPIYYVSKNLSPENRLFYRVFDNTTAVMGGFVQVGEGTLEDQTVYQSLFEGAERVMLGEKTVDEWQLEMEEVSGLLRDSINENN